MTTFKQMTGQCACPATHCSLLPQSVPSSYQTFLNIFLLCACVCKCTRQQLELDHTRVTGPSYAMCQQAERPEPTHVACVHVSVWSPQTRSWSSWQVGQEAWEPHIGAAMSLGQILERPAGLRVGYWRDQEVQVSYWRDQDIWGLATGVCTYASLVHKAAGTPVDPGARHSVSKANYWRDF